MKKIIFLIGMLFNIQFLFSFAIYTALAEAEENRVMIHVPRVHIVQDGENLWNLSKENFRDPLKWRKIWENNTFVINPNLIYPGDQLLVPGQFMQKEVLLVEPEKSADSETIAESATIAEPERKSELAEIVPVVLLPPPDPEPIKFVSDSVFHKSGFIVSEEKWSGKIVSGPEERSIFGDRDRLYVNMSEKVSVGDKFKIVEKLREVFHPVTQKKIGILIQESGTLEITEVRDENSTAIVSESYSDIKVGNLLMREDSLNSPIDLTSEREDKSIEEGYIIHGKESMSVFGNGSIVYIDKGEENGIKVGDRFQVFNERKEQSGKESKESSNQQNNIFPPTIYGKIEVFNLRKKTSTALVIESKKEFYVGTKIKYVKN